MARFKASCFDEKALQPWNQALRCNPPVITQDDKNDNPK